MRKTGKNIAPPDVFQSLEDSYNWLCCYLGDTVFSELVRGVVKSPVHDNLPVPALVKEMPAYLAKTQPYAHHPEIAEFAALELALKTACQSEAGPIFTLGDLAKIDLSQLACAVLDIQKPLTKLRFATNVTSLWSSLRCGVSPPKPERLDGPVDVIVWRQARAARFRIVGDEEAFILAEAGQGVPFGELWQHMAGSGEPETAAGRAHSYLRGWIEAELICDISIPPICADAK